MPAAGQLSLSKSGGQLRQLRAGPPPGSSEPLPAVLPGQHSSHSTHTGTRTGWGGGGGEGERRRGGGYLERRGGGARRGMECEVCGEVVVWSVVPESSAALQLRSAQPGRPPPAPLKAFCAAGRPALSPPHYTTLSAHRTGTPAPALRHCHFSTSFSQSLQSDITQTGLQPAIAPAAEFSKAAKLPLVRLLVRQSDSGGGL